MRSMTTTKDTSRRSVVVTGAGGGLGLAIAERLAADSWQVVGVERSEVRARKFVERIGMHGKLVQGDVVDPDVLAEAVSRAEEVGPLTGWVNNAAVNRRGNLHEEIVSADVEAVFEVNLLAPFRGCGAAIRSFIANGIAGRIVNVSSIHATHAFPGFAAYDTAKGGINSLTRYVAVEYGPIGIRANAIAPGAIETEMLSRAIRDSADPDRERRDMAKLHPLERLGRPAEVAAVAAFLLSDEASFVSGQIVGVDGGASARAFRFESDPDPDAT